MFPVALGADVFLAYALAFSFALIPTNSLGSYIGEQVLIDEKLSIVRCLLLAFGMITVSGFLGGVFDILLPGNGFSSGMGIILSLINTTYATIIFGSIQALVLGILYAVVLDYQKKHFKYIKTIE